MADDIADALYALPLEEFVAARDAKARELRREKRRDEAAAVTALSKPSRPAWIVNMLARDETALMAKLLECAEALEEAQEAALSGGGASDLRAATRAERKAVDQLLAAARDLRPEGQRASAAILERVRVTLQAGAGDPALRELMRAGRVVEEPAAGGAWPFAVGGDEGEAAPAPAARRSGKGAGRRGAGAAKEGADEERRSEEGAGEGRRGRPAAGEGADGKRRSEEAAEDGADRGRRAARAAADEGSGKGGRRAEAAEADADARAGRGGDGAEATEQERAAAKEEKRRADEERAARRREIQGALTSARKAARDIARERERAQRDAERAADRLERLAAEVEAAREAAESAAARRDAAQAEASAAEAEVARLEGELRGR
jgi:hypothetical protein